MQTETLSTGLSLSQFWFSHVLLCSVLPVWVGTKGLKVRTWQKPGCALELSLHWALRPLSSGVATVRCRPLQDALRRGVM